MQPHPPLDPRLIVAETQAWLDRAVIGLNLCPFAKAVRTRGQIRFHVCGATDAPSLLAELGTEMSLLASIDAAQLDTTLLIHPEAFGDFLDYNEFLGLAESALADAGFEGVFQIASFHPQYRFAGTRANDPANATNRSPYPMLHLLREASVERAVAAFPDPAAIVDKNIATLRSMGAKRWQALLRQCNHDALIATGPPSTTPEFFAATPNLPIGPIGIR